MRPRQRQARIAELVEREGKATVEALASLFSVSAETIRRDLMRLSESGAVQKVHGGARRARLAVEGPFEDRMAENAGGKRTVAEKLAGLIEPGDTLFLDTGSTTLACAEALADKPGLTVVTNSPRIAEVIGRGPGRATVFLLGGRYEAANGETAGPLTIAQIARFHADHAVLTVAALDPEAGAMDADFDEAQIARAMIDSAEHVMVVATTVKFGRKAAYPVCGLEEIDVLVCDARPDAPFAAALALAGVAVP